MTAQDHEMPKDVVPPGDQTGVYYIPISNLPFNVSWQQIKDHVRQVCEVDHVELFQKSTAGWVRVKGRENFEAAFGHLNGKELGGRAIIADGRNGDSPILVRDLEVCKPTGPTKTRSSSGGGKSVDNTSSSYAVGGPVSYPDSSMFSSPTSTTGSAYSQVGSSSHTSSSSYSSSSAAGARQDHLRAPEYEYQCHMSSMPGARELMMMPRQCTQQQPDGYSMSMASSSFMGSPDMSYSQGLVTGYDSMMMTGAAAAASGFSHPVPYGFSPAQTTQSQSYMSPYQTSSGGSDAMYNVSTSSYAAYPSSLSAGATTADYNDYYLAGPSSSTSTTLATQMSNLAISSGSGGGIYTEQRGVHIRDISRRASEDQIRKYIREATGPEAAAHIEAIRVPVQEGGAPRGHAFVHFRDASLARGLVDRLNGREFKGRRLQVRLMKEGDAIGSGGSGGGVASSSSASSSKGGRSSGGKHSHSSHHSHSHHHGGGGGDRRRSERKDRDKSGAVASSSGSKAGPLVVSGGGSTNSTLVTASGSKEKHGKKSSSVVVADGSSPGRTR